VLRRLDLDAATRSYARLLGRRPSWRGDHPAAGTANTLFRLENTVVELLTPEGEGPVGAALRGWLDARGESPVGLALGTDDAEACRAWLAERGLAPGEVEAGMGRDAESGAFRRWRRVPIPLERTRGVVVFAIQRLSPDEILPPAEALLDEEGAVFALDHAVVRTSDPEAVKTLYGERLGLRLALDREFPQWGARLLFFRIGGVTLEFAASLDRPSEPDASDRLWGLSYRVRDADAARTRLVALGFDLSEVRPGRKPGTRVLTVRDGTHGIPTLLLEPPAQRPSGAAGD
jgi:catechol 2,3-dioxygenase-like lactoylglutathione lyase family enzyme